MRTKIVEGTTPDGLYLKAMVCRFDADDWSRRSLVAQDAGFGSISLLRQEGWGDNHYVIIDLSNPGPANVFDIRSHPKHDAQLLDKF